MDLGPNRLSRLGKYKNQFGESILQISKIRSNTSPYLIYAVFSRFIYLLIFLISSILTKSENLLGANCRYDCKWYLEIAKNGYSTGSISPGDPNFTIWGFFPLFPYTVKLIHVFLNLDLRLISYFLNALLFTVGTIFLGKYLEGRYDQLISRRTILLLCFSPINVYFCSGYSEAGFFCLISALIWFLYSNNLFAAVLAGSLLGISRNTGLIIAALLFVFIYLHRRINLRGTIITGLSLTLCSAPLLLHIILLRRINGDSLGLINRHGVEPSNPIAWLFQTFSFQSPLQIALLSLLIFAIYVTAQNFRLGNSWEAIVLIPAIVTSLVYPEFINWRYLLVLYPIYLRVVVLTSAQRISLYFRLFFFLNFLAMIFAIYSWIQNFGYMV